MSEVLFYHLEARSLEEVLPDLLARSVERGWRAVVQAGSEERVRDLDAHLWTFEDASFLPHGSGADPFASEQPIWLTTGEDNPNRATVRFLVDGATTEAFDGYERVVFVFGDGDADAMGRVRAAWRRAREAGHPVAYWRQDARGRWAKQDI
jgi:DNA polymerase III subunit chi